MRRVRWLFGALAVVSFSLAALAVRFGLGEMTAAAVFGEVVVLGGLGFVFAMLALFLPPAP